MGITIGVSEAMADRLREFATRHDADLEIVAGDAGAVRVVESEGRQQSDMTTLHAGGWIRCADAQALAGKLELPKRTMARLLDHLDIKIRECELGCF